MKKCYINPDYADRQWLRDFIDQLPEAFATEGTLLWDGRNKIKAFHVADTVVVAKRFKPLSAFQKLIYAFRRHKAHKAFLNGMELRRRGFDTPEPLACVEFRQGPWLKDAFYLCRQTTYPSVESHFDRPDWDHELATAFARYAASLHEKGVLHNDLNDTNVLYSSQPDGSYHFAVIDINRMKFYPPGSLIPDKECIENLTRFTGRIDLFKHVIREYAKTRGLDEEEWAQKGVAQKKRHDRNWYRRKRLLHPHRYRKKQINTITL